MPWPPKSSDLCESAVNLLAELDTFLYTLLAGNSEIPTEYPHRVPCGRGGGATPLYGIYMYVRPQRVINRVSIVVILVINRIWFLHSCLELDMFFRRSYFLIIIETPSTKALSRKLYLGQLRQLQRSKTGYQIFGQVIKRVGKIGGFCHK